MKAAKIRGARRCYKEGFKLGLMLAVEALFE